MPAASLQAGLFDAPDTPARQPLMGSIDRLNAGHGRGTISVVRSGRQRVKLRSENHPPRLHDELGGAAAGLIERSSSKCVTTWRNVRSSTAIEPWNIFLFTGDIIGHKSYSE